MEVNIESQIYNLAKEEELRIELNQNENITLTVN